jgi:hypothetical protein
MMLFLRWFGYWTSFESVIAAAGGVRRLRYRTARSGH